MNKPLSNRELQVLTLIADEQSMSQIASTLYISTHTVVSHRRNLLRKLNARNTAGLIVKAFRHGFIPMSQTSVQAI